MRLLVTNDDGIAAAGIAALADVVVDAGHEVLVAAPSGERSGSSAALTVVEVSDGVRTENYDLSTVPGASALRVHASPAMITMMACSGVFGDVPDLVLSGINHGPNTGRTVLHSGTVGAALTAVAHGVPAIAFSHLGAPDNWSTAAAVARTVVQWATAAPTLPSAALNVNSPDCALAELRGLRLAHLATFGSAQARLKGSGHTSTVTVSESPFAPEPGTDEALLAAGYATITPVIAPSEVAADLAGLVPDGAAHGSSGRERTRRADVDELHQGIDFVESSGR